MVNRFSGLFSGNYRTGKRPTRIHSYVNTCRSEHDRRSHVYDRRCDFGKHSTSAQVSTYVDTYSILIIFYRYIRRRSDN